MRSLFLKIFLSYWLALALFLVLAILATLALHPQRESAARQAMQARVLAEAVQAYQHGGPAEALSYFHGLREAQHLHAYLFNEQGEELSGRTPPPWIQRVLRGQIRTADGFWGRLGFGPLRFLRQSMTAANGHTYTLVLELPPPPRLLFGPGSIPGLAILIAIISSGLVCYVLARYLTAPVVRLRAATQKLAAGNLSARAGVPSSRRRDEMAELVRDFDSMAERLEKLANAQARLLTDISHELRSPLARLHVALALARQRSGSEAQSALERIEVEANRLNQLIGGLLTIVRLEGGDDSPPRSPLHLREMIGEVVKDADFEAQSRHCHVKCVIKDDATVIGVPGLLRSAIENVVRNATRYTQEGTGVEVCLERGPGPDSPALITVTDHGPGVPDEALGKLFRPFYRIDDARGRATGGVGLGLAITERAVRLHGGTVRAANRPEGGLLVEIQLPAVAADVPAMPVAAAPIQPARS